MAYTALSLITRAYYLSQVVARELQEVSGAQVTDGLFLLNSILDFKGSDLRAIPYFKQYQFNAVQGQEKYEIPNLLYIDAMTFNIGPVRYSMNDMTRKDYFASPRVDDIQSLPFGYRPERTLDGMDIYLYFLPEANYVMKLWGKFGFDEVTLFTDLSTVFDGFYLEYLRFALAEQICSDWGTTFPDASKKILAQYEKKILDVSPPDLSIQKQGYWGGGNTWDWQSINLSRGYFPF